MPGFILRIISKIESSPVGIVSGLVSFVAIIILRLFIEGWLDDFRSHSGVFFFYEFSQFLLFFSILYLLLWELLLIFIKINIRKISSFLLFSFLFILIPPVIDAVISKGKGFWSFYDFGSLHDLGKYFFNFFDDTPEIGVTYGGRTMLVLAIVFLFLYIYIKSKSFLKSLLASFILYCIFFFLGTFPSWVTIATEGFSKGVMNIKEIDIVRQFLVPSKIFSREIMDITSSFAIKLSLIYIPIVAVFALGGAFFHCREKLFSFLKNIYFPQIIYHGGLLIIGMGLGLAFSGGKVELNFFNAAAFLVLLIAITCAWLASVVVNDFFNREIGRKTNTGNPLANGTIAESEYRLAGIILFVASIFFSAIINFTAAYLLVAYQAITWVYSAYPLRLKRFMFVSTFLIAVASLIVLFIGYIIVSPNQSLNDLPFGVIALLVTAFTLSLPVKDFKNVVSDKTEGFFTIPVVFGEQWGKIIVATGILLSYLLSVAVLHEYRLFWWAILCGGASFWIVSIMKKDNGITYQNVFWWILGMVIVYVLVIAGIIF